MRMSAVEYLEVDNGLIPTGSMLSVQGTPFDFNNQTWTIGDRTDNVHPSGYDHCYVLEKDLNKYEIAPQTIKEACRVFSPISKIRMTFSTTEPGFQFYAGSKILEGHKPKKTQAKDGSFVIGPYSGFCLEAQRFPNAINNEQWRKQVVLEPGKQYKQTSVYKFEFKDDV